MMMMMFMDVVCDDGREAAFGSLTLERPQHPCRFPLLEVAFAVVLRDTCGWLPGDKSFHIYQKSVPKGTTEETMGVGAQSGRDNVCMYFWGSKHTV